eukprot:m.1644980 g.1644980  ORF g.1644980 m.1644980 type:complete len:57 (+) comp65117_c0_seq1:59-229(+)
MSNSCDANLGENYGLSADMHCNADLHDTRIMRRTASVHACRTETQPPSHHLLHRQT